MRRDYSAIIIEFILEAIAADFGALNNKICAESAPAF